MTLYRLLTRQCVHFIGSLTGVLRVDFDNIHNRLVVTKPVSFEEIQSEAATYIKSGILPLMDVGQFYEAHQPKP